MKTSGQILVVAPHPDDDVIGCGGTLHRCARDGTPINVVYVTDGSASHPGSKRFPPRELAVLREQEARNALFELGIFCEPAFLRVPDGTVEILDGRGRESIVAELVRMVTKRGVTTIFEPWKRDPHPDHRATCELVELACARLSAHVPRRLAYTVWTAARGGPDEHPGPDECVEREVALDARDLSAKRRALLRHRSQTSDLIDDDPSGFRIDATLMSLWLRDRECFYECP